MNFSRERWAVIRLSDGKVFCGKARNYYWKSLEDIGNTSICTYMSEAKALASVKASYGYPAEWVRAIKVVETLVDV